MSEPKSAGLPAKDIDEIRRAAEDFAGYMIDRDFEALAGLYSEDAVVMPPHHPTVRGRKAIQQFLGNFPRVTRFEPEIEEIEGRADLAYVRGTCLMAMQPDGAPGPVDQPLKYIEIHKRQSDGSWPIVVDIFNSDE